MPCHVMPRRAMQVVHVVGDRPDEPPPAGWVSTASYTAESGWIDEV